MVPRRQRKGGAALSSPSTPSTPSFASPSSSWVDPVFHFGAGASSGLTGGLGVLPWWAQDPGGFGTAGANGDGSLPAPPSPTYTTTPESHRSPGYMGQAAPGYSVGGSPTGELGPGYELNARQAHRMAQLLGSFTGVPGLPQAVDMYAQRTGANNPFGPAEGGSYTPGVTVTDNDTNQPPQVVYRGYGSDPYGGGFGDVYYGPARGGNLVDYGDAAMNDFGASQADHYNLYHPGQNIAGVGIGGFGSGWTGGASPGASAGGADFIHSGTASPWDWGGGLFY